MIISKVSKIEEFIILFNTINYYKNKSVNVFIKDSNNSIHTWNMTLFNSDDESYNATSHSAYIQLDHFPYARTKCVCFFSLDDGYGGGIKIIIMSSSNVSCNIKSYTIDLLSNDFYNLTLIHQSYEDSRFK